MFHAMQEGIEQVRLARIEIIIAGDKLAVWEKFATSPKRFLPEKMIVPVIRL